MRNDLRGRALLASAGLLLVAFIWGVAFAVVKNSLEYIPAIWMLAFRFLIAALSMMAVFGKRVIIQIRRDQKILIHGLYLGIFLFVAYAMQTVGCKYTTAGKNAFITALYVVLVPFVHWIRTRKRPKSLCFAAAFLAIAAIGLISLNGDLTVNKGDFLTMICGIVYALQIEYLGKYTESEDPIALSVLMIVFSAVFSWIFAPIADGSLQGVEFNRELVIGILYLGFLSTMVCFMLQSICQKYIKTSTAAIIMSMEAVFGAAASALVLGERMPLRTYIGCGLMFVAVLLAQADVGEPAKEREKDG